MKRVDLIEVFVVIKKTVKADILALQLQ